jgi:hypothetical protein
MLMTGRCSNIEYANLVNGYLHPLIRTVTPQLPEFKESRTAGTYSFQLQLHPKSSLRTVCQLQLDHQRMLLPQEVAFLIHPVGRLRAELYIEAQNQGR